MNIDHFHCIGSEHVSNAKPCQDYSRTYIDASRGIFAGAIADGCSGSKGDPSVGAMFLVNDYLQIVKHELYQTSPDIGIKDSLIFGMKDLCDRGYCYDDFFATLIGMVKTPTSFNVHWFGDGYVVLRYFDGIVKVKCIEYPFNMPAYLVHELTEDIELFIAHTGNTYKLITYTLNSDGELLSTEEEDLKATDYLTLDLQPEVESLASVSIFSDGLGLLKGDEPAPLYWKDCTAALNLTTFANVKGDFVKRAVTARFNRKKKFIPFDDYSQVTYVSYD